MRCPRCTRALPEKASLCRACGHVLDAALLDGPGDGSGFTQPGASIHDIAPHRTVPSKATTSGAGQGGSASARPGFPDVPPTQPAEGGTSGASSERAPSLPPEFSLDDDETSGAAGEEGATIIDTSRHLTPSQLSALRRPDPAELAASLDDRTVLSSVPEAVLQHLAAAGADASADDDGMVFQATERWERPAFSRTPTSEAAQAPGSAVGPEDATVVRASSSSRDRAALPAPAPAVGPRRR